MEITNVNIKSGKVVGYRNTDGDMDYIKEENKYLSPTLSEEQRVWLDGVCVYINQNNFDTCRNDYSDCKYDIRNGYNQAYNTYLWEFENC